MPVLIPPLVPGSPEWLRHMSASKVAAVMGTSPYESRFSLWLRMHGDLAPQEQTAAMGRGHYLERGVVQWWRDQEHDLEPGWALSSNDQCWRHDSEPWIATPDRVIDCCFGDIPLEIKTAADSDEWGPDGSDEVPAGYRDQVQWQMHVMGAPRCHVAVLLPFLEFRQYVVEYDAARCALIETEVRAFMASLDAGERPDLDAHGATYTALRALHPEIDPVDVEVPDDLAREFVTAVTDAKDATAREKAARSRLFDHMGTAQKATWGGSVIATRQAKGEGMPYLVAAKNLPTIDESSAA